MSALTIYSEKDAGTPLWQSTDGDEIQQQLNAKGVRFERWQADRDLGVSPTPETVIEAYQHAIDKLVAEKGYQSWDVISLRADNPQKEALRAKFLNEHTHGEDEVRFFVEGAGLFCLHIGNEVFQVLCEKNDLISVPADTPHWFDMGSEPNFTAIPHFRQPGRLGSEIYRRRYRRRLPAAGITPQCNNAGWRLRLTRPTTSPAFHRPAQLGLLRSLGGR